MISFQQSDVVLVALTKVDRELVTRYLRYSDYIFRVLGGADAAVTDPWKYIDTLMRSPSVSRTASQQFPALNELYRQDLGVWVSTQNLYGVVIAASAEGRQLLAPIIQQDIPARLRLFTRRLGTRYDADTPDAQDAFEWMMKQLARPKTAPTAWNDDVSMPSFSLLTRFEYSRQVMQYNYSAVFPALFQTRRDLTPVRTDITRVLASFATARAVPVERVRKILGIPS